MATCDLSRNPTQVETPQRRPRRRDFLTIGAAAAAVDAGIKAPAAEADPFAFARPAGADDNHDAAILDLFQQWRSAFIAIESVKGRDCDPEVDVLTALAEQIFTAPISGAVGLAIKCYMFCYEVGIHLNCAGVYGQRPGEIGQLPEKQYACRYDWQTASQNEDATLYMLPQAMLGALDAAVHFLPELAPLAAGALSSPRVLPAGEEGDDE